MIFDLIRLPKYNEMGAHYTLVRAITPQREAHGVINALGIFMT
jgi:hypothetical protein